MEIQWRHAAVATHRARNRSAPRRPACCAAVCPWRCATQWWAAGYNVFAIPLAAGVLAPQGFVLFPAVGAVLMSASTVIVALNAQLLRRARV